MKQEIQNIIRRSIDVKTALLNDEVAISQIETVAKKMIESYKQGHKTMFAGNGGSAADAQHLAAELVNRFCFDHLGLPAIALTTDTSIVTAIGNDYGYDFLFTRQIAALGNAGDVFIGISTSGNSENIVKALEYCKEKGIYTVGLTGGNGGKMKSLCDECIVVPSNETARIQESHIVIGHILCGFVESAMFEKK
ncbi:MAG: D-sedoheptulose 7-phosphate isomerase [Bacteroidales bacterium]|nr:D-sedoheptulose 7-phosphate isomerase [Bacteroidales bacterium]